MPSALAWPEDDPAPSETSPRPDTRPRFSLDAVVWHADELARIDTPVSPSGWPALDAELPGGGWPLQSVIEILAAQPSVLEWRLLTPALRARTADGGQLVVIGPPRHPHLPGLLHEGLDDRRLVWIQAEHPAERLWVTEQLIKANATAALVSWLPQARQEQLRRLQVCAQGCEGLVFLCRPEAARHEASAAPLRVHASASLDWELELRILKRRGPPHEGVITLPSIPGGLSSVLTPRVRKPSRLIARPEAAIDVVGRPAAVTQPRQHAAIR